MAQERRVVCVVFAQAVGLTELPEAERAAATDALFLQFRAVVERHGGTVDKFIGDVAMSVFGAPVARGNDEARAMRAALEMRLETREFSARRQLALDFRAGANTGEVLWGGIGGDRATATGDVVNVARRVMEAAAPGEILATAAVEERTRRDIAWSGTEQLKLRGREQPVDVFTASRPADAGTVSAAPKGPMVGRAAELAALLESPSAFFVVEGSAGSGKTRLLAEFRRAVRDRDPQAFVATGRAVEGAPAPLGPFADILRAAAGTSEPEALAAWLAPALGDAPGAADARFAADALLASIGLAPAGSRASELPADRAESEGRAAWARWLRVRAQAAPVALCLEDLQEADESTPGLMAYLAKELAGERVAIVGATRPGPAEIPGYRRLALRDLGEPETVAIAAAALGRSPGPRLAAFLREQAGGHPFYVAELARWLSSAGHLSGDPAELAASPAGLPDGLHGLLVARLDAEPAEEKEALKGASVVGRAFWVSIVNETLGREVARPIEEARARGLVTAGGPAPLAGDPELAFAHALLRDAAYALLPRRERARLHAAAAVALDAREPAAGRRAVELAARHHEAAGDTATASTRWLHAATLAYRELSVAESLACGREALRLGGSAEAHAHVASCLMALSRFAEALPEAALGADPAAPPDVRTRALLTRASTFERTSRFPEAVEAAGEALAAAPTNILRAEAEWNRGNALFRLDRTDEALACYDRADALLVSARAAGEPPPTAPIAARILSTRGLVMFRLGRHAESRDFQVRALAEFRAAGRRRDCAVALANLAGPLRQLEDHDGASRVLAEALPIARESGDRSLEATVLHNIGVGIVNGDHPEQALECFVKSRQLRESVGDRIGQIHSLSSELMAHAVLQNTPEATRALRETMDLAKRFPPGDRVLLILVDAVVAGLDVVGVERSVEAFQAMRDLASPSSRPDLLASEGAALAFRGRVAEARAALEEARNGMKAFPDPRAAGSPLGLLATLEMMAGDTVAAEKALLESERLGLREDGPGAWDRLVARAGLREQAGDSAAAREFYRRALVLSDWGRLPAMAALDIARLSPGAADSRVAEIVEEAASSDRRVCRVLRPRARATLALGLAAAGERRRASELLAGAKAGLEAPNTAYERILAEEMISRARLALGDREDADRRLASALDRARSCGYLGLARRIERDAASLR